MTLLKKEEKYRLSHSQIKRWLQKQNSYSINKTAKRNFQRSRVIVSGIDDQFDADLASFIPYSDDNDGYKYLLVVIDIFSRHAWIEPIKDKTANEIVKAFNKIISEGRIPHRLRTDGATDFTSKNFKIMLNLKKLYISQLMVSSKQTMLKDLLKQSNLKFTDILFRKIHLDI